MNIPEETAGSVHGRCLKSDKDTTRHVEEFLGLHLADNPEEQTRAAIIRRKVLLNQIAITKTKQFLDEAITMTIPDRLYLPSQREMWSSFQFKEQGRYASPPPSSAIGQSMLQASSSLLLQQQDLFKHYMANEETTPSKSTPGIHNHGQVASMRSVDVKESSFHSGDKLEWDHHLQTASFASRPHMVQRVSTEQELMRHRLHNDLMKRNNATRVRKSRLRSSKHNDITGSKNTSVNTQTMDENKEGTVTGISLTNNKRRGELMMKIKIKKKQRRASVETAGQNTFYDLANIRRI